MAWDGDHWTVASSVHWIIGAVVRFRGSLPACRPASASQDLSVAPSLWTSSTDALQGSVSRGLLDGEHENSSPQAVRWSAQPHPGRWVPATNALVSEDEVRCWGEPGVCLAELSPPGHHSDVVRIGGSMPKSTDFRLPALCHFRKLSVNSLVDLRNIGHVVTLLPEWFQCTNNHQLVSTTSSKEDKEGAPRHRLIDQCEGDTFSAVNSSNHHLEVRLRFSMGNK